MEIQHCDSCLKPIMKVVQGELQSIAVWAVNLPIIHPGIDGAGVATFYLCGPCFLEAAHSLMEFFKNSTERRAVEIPALRQRAVPPPDTGKAT